MNAAHIHLMLNHLPIVGLLIGFIILLPATWRQSATLLQTVWILFIALAVIGLAVAKSGEGAEELLEKIPGVDHRLIHEHEEYAEKSVYLLMLLGALSAIHWTLFKRGKWNHWHGISLLIVALGALIYLAWVAYTGGLIRHPEIAF